MDTFINYAHHAYMDITNYVPHIIDQVLESISDTSKPKGVFGNPSYV